MLSKLLPILMLLIGVGGGIGAGIMLAPPPAEEHDAMTAEEGADHGDGHGEEMAEDAGHDEDGHSDDEHAIPNDFIKISNQFVIPVVERDQLTSMVVVSLSLETKPGLAEKVHSFEPKLRDVFLRVLFDHANMGGFRGAFTRSEVLDPLRTSLREEGRRFLGKDLVDVLILDITRQDV
ncbi:flagellar basal body-associated FliL family protein [Phaeobacter sp. HF9A]|uniref:flagellar basal body-associated FliL family protein n=1 Tax=Phaeobacter sp. HF9A TaxID=2721561 RepID=UPI001430733F|nr:flagellar basal body-associated FliL family protein [Phaeobacter sp. HF9A]NIZ11878.1 flagellar basal body-associated FliL family protein [Phaeobacter sp. HF9A]